ncbi:AIPR family protein [Aeromicrobium sp. CFBP 8757]|uniref:AIPR family protein n=1 Tax=Aeromicrobium sp. CFBP 8757 TaxID=2775288 RepID=UPI00177DB9C1|nr:AIPR family protein [Aeromicrobium sp. CFBP 8757]MBD8605356.1 AIPR family protein [Aeromicrobium sp. CFBP 8757]
MDRVTKSYLEEFRSEQSLASGLSESTMFEYFADYCVVSLAHEEEFDAQDVHVGGEGDLGLDGLAIIVNGVLIGSVEEASDLLDINGFLDVKFIFVQAKTSSGFNGEQIMTFFDGIDEFFAEDPTLPLNEQVEGAREIMSWLYSKSVKFKRQKPVIEMSFVTTGQWQEDAYLTAKVDKRKGQLMTTGLFHGAKFTPLGANEIQAAYQRSKNNVTVEFSFANKVLLPEIEGVEEAYLGVLPVKEYLSLITDPVGNIRKPLFYDNVRDFQGDNDVNSEIRETLKDPSGQQRFAVLNNGVTVVTRGLDTTGNKFVVTDYQIVNGCQTSHVLFDAAEELGDEVHVPLKVISTADEEIISAIITATNRQTEVTAEDLYAMSAFQKRLEALYDAFPDKKKLHYERRSKQYASANGIEKVRIIGKTLQVRAFAAMFLDDAHRAARYYGDLRAQVGTKIFIDAHKLEPYYVSAYGYYKLEFLFRNNLLPVYYKPARYHLLMALRYLIGGTDMPALTANKATGYANKIAEVLWADEASVEVFKEAIELIDEVLAGDALTRDVVKTQSFTDSVKAAAVARAEARKVAAEATAAKL